MAKHPHRCPVTHAGTPNAGSATLDPQRWIRSSELSDSDNVTNIIGDLRGAGTVVVDAWAPRQRKIKDDQIVRLVYGDAS